MRFSQLGVERRGLDKLGDRRRRSRSLVLMFCDRARQGIWAGKFSVNCPQQKLLRSGLWAHVRSLFSQRAFLFFFLFGCQEYGEKTQESDRRGGFIALFFCVNVGSGEPLEQKQGKVFSVLCLLQKNSLCSLFGFSQKSFSSSYKPEDS